MKICLIIENDITVIIHPYFMQVAIWRKLRVLLWRLWHPHMLLICQKPSNISPQVAFFHFGMWPKAFPNLDVFFLYLWVSRLELNDMHVSATLAHGNKKVLYFFSSFFFFFFSRATATYPDGHRVPNLKFTATVTIEGSPEQILKNEGWGNDIGDVAMFLQIQPQAKNLAVTVRFQMIIISKSKLKE